MVIVVLMDVEIKMMRWLSNRFVALRLRFFEEETLLEAFDILDKFFAQDDLSSKSDIKTLRRLSDGQFLIGAELCRRRCTFW